jgi:hypothetical protein
MIKAIIFIGILMKEIVSELIFLSNQITYKLIDQD